LAANSLYADEREVKVEDRMSKRAVATKSAISSARAATTTVRKKSRPVKAARPAAEPPPATVDFWQGYEEWQPIKANPAKRRAYIKKICRRIAEAFKPEKIIHFGSQAYGKPRPDSDVDLLVVMQFEGGCFHQAHKIRMRLGLSLPIDLLVYTSEQLQYRLEIGDRFMQEIVERGKVMYGANHD
jgi:predicted nucleotidyltransferase